MTPDFNAQLSEFQFPTEVSDFWDKEVSEYVKHKKVYLQHSLIGDLPLWLIYYENSTIEDLIDLVSDIYQMDLLSNRTRLDNKDEEFFSIKLLQLLDSDEFPVSQLLPLAYQETLNTLGFNTHGNLPKFQLYLHYVDWTDNSISQEDYYKYTTVMLKDGGSQRKMDEHIGLYFSLLKVTPQDYVTWENFIQTIETLAKDINSTTLNYHSQLSIYNYTKDNFPQYLNETSNYYPNLVNKPIFVTQNLYQELIDINLFQLTYQYNLNPDKIYHLVNIVKHSLPIMAEKEFQDLINQHIQVTNTKTEDKGAIFSISFSTKTENELALFKEIVLTVLQNVLILSEEIHIEWIETYSGPHHLHTNLKPELLSKAYLYGKLNGNMEGKPTKSNKKI